jgi:hypothetical protein
MARFLTSSLDGLGTGFGMTTTGSIGMPEMVSFEATSFVGSRKFLFSFFYDIPTL